MKVVNSEDIKPLGMEQCVFCQGTLKSRFVDMDNVSSGISMEVGDNVWKSYEEEEDCTECHQMGFTVLPSNLFMKIDAAKILNN